MVLLQDDDSFMTFLCNAVNFWLGERRNHP